jgi:hypothetical protein
MKYWCMNVPCVYVSICLSVCICVYLVEVGVYIPMCACVFVYMVRKYALVCTFMCCMGANVCALLWKYMAYTMDKL